MKRPITATLWRSTGPRNPRELVWVRHYSWVDTAVARASQLALYCQEGDVIEFASIELGFQIGTLKVLAGCKTQLTYSELIKSSPTLLKLFNEIKA